MGDLSFLRYISEEVNWVNLLYFIAGTSLAVQIHQKISHKHRVQVVLDGIDDFLSLVAVFGEFSPNRVQFFEYTRSLMKY